MSAALTRRAALRGSAAAALGLGAGVAAAQAAPALSANDARLIAISAELRATYDRTSAIPSPAEHHPEWDGLISRFEPLEDEMAEMQADTMAGVLAKARALQIPTCRECARPDLGNSLADDVSRLFGGGAHA